MIIIGELINGTRKAVGEAIKNRDAEYIADLARRQAEAGADYIDCNAGTGGEAEIEDLVWIVETVQSAVDKPLCIDSPNPEAIKRALDIYSGPTPIINSITLEQKRLEGLLDLVASSDCGVVALALSDKGMPSDADDRVANAVGLVQALQDAAVEAERIYVDPVVMPIGTDFNAGRHVLEAIQRIRSQFPDVHITCGLSNISYGLPNRRLINRAFLAAAICAGLDSAILDPLDADLMAIGFAAEAVAGRDEWCANYIQAHRGGKL